MSAQNFANKIGELDASNPQDGADPSTSSNPTDTAQPKGRTRAAAAKGKKNDVSVEGRDDLGDGVSGESSKKSEKVKNLRDEGKNKDGEGEGRTVTGEGGEPNSKGASSDPNLLGNAEGNGEESQHLEIGIISGRGRVVENMRESVYVEITHKKWIHNIRAAFTKSNETQYRLLSEEYKKWCKIENTNIRRIDLFDLDCEERMEEEAVTSSEKSKEPTKNKIEVNTLMKLDADVGHNMTKLSEYFDKLMINKTIHVPVSIFCPKWLLLDTSYMRKKRTKTSCSSDETIYNGYPVPSEWRLSFAEWSVRYNLMLKYQELTYDVLDSQKESPIAPRLAAHRENVLQIQIDCDGKWTPAMRYDIAHRRNVWENRLACGGMADVGKLNKKLAEQAERDAKNHGDYNYLDNPFVVGGPMQNISPFDGSVNPSWDTPGSVVDSHVEVLTGRSVVVWGQQPKTVPVAGAANTSGVVCNTNYKGRFYDPYYRQKQQASQNMNRNQNQHYQGNGNQFQNNNNNLSSNNNQSYNTSYNQNNHRGSTPNYQRGRGRGNGHQNSNRLTIQGAQAPLAIEGPSVVVASGSGVNNQVVPNPQ